MHQTTRKRRTRAHVIADLSVNHVERHILRCGWTAQRFNPDYGLDLLMTTFDRRGCIENGDVRLQLKATDSVRLARSSSAIAVRLAWKDMVYWLNEPLPVILIFYDATADRAWWIHLNDSLRELGRTSTTARLTLHIPITNVLDIDAVRNFRKLRDATLRRSRG